jgi:hypothetical protein
MRRQFVTLAGTLGFAFLGLAGSGSANATALGSTSLRPAADSIASVEKTACWRQGWHGWGWYPCGGPVVVAPAPVVVAPGPAAVVVAPGPGPCYGRGWHRVCNGWGHCWRACN